MDCIIIDDTNTGFKPEPKLCHGVSPTLRATRSGLKTICDGGGLPVIFTEEEFKVLSERKDIKRTDRFCRYCDKQLFRKRFNGRLEDFAVFGKRLYCDRECMKRGYLKIGKTEANWSNAHASARNINRLILGKDSCEQCGAINNLDIHHKDGDWQNNCIDNLECLCRSCHMKVERGTHIEGGAEQGFRVRKLTPRETWRLMGFDDEDFNAAQSALNDRFYKGKDRSSSQLYKQAGNSIVVDVLEQIFGKLYEKMPYLFDDMTIGSFFSGIGAFEKALDNLEDALNYDTCCGKCRKKADAPNPQLNQIGCVTGSNSIADRIYDDGMARTILGEAGGGGAKTGWYAVQGIAQDDCDR